MSDLITQILSAPKIEWSELIRRADTLALKGIVTSNDVDMIDIVLTAVDHQALSRLISVLEAHQVQRALLTASPESVGNFLRLVQVKQLSKVLVGATNELLEHLFELAPSREFRLKIAKSLPADRERQWLQILSDNERSILELKRVREGATSSLLDERKRLLHELEQAIQERQEVLSNLQSQALTKREHYKALSEQTQAQLHQLQRDIAEKENTLQKREEDLANRILEFEETTRLQVQQRIEIKVPEYVAEAVRVLETRESQYRKKAFAWGVHGTILLILAIMITVAISLYGFLYGESLSTLGWQAMIFVSFKGLVVLGVLGLWAKHAFTVSNAYMHEAIKRADRAHAINFGKLYLEVYGNTVERKELIDIFENWNITSESAFSKVSLEGFEPKILEKLTDILQSTGRSKESVG